MGGVVEYYIPFGVDRNPSGTGRADIIYFNAATMTAEVIACIVCVVSGGSLFPAAAALVLLFMFLGK